MVFILKINQWEGLVALRTYNVTADNVPAVNIRFAFIRVRLISDISDM